MLSSELVTGSVADSFSFEFKSAMKRYGYYIGDLFEKEAKAA